MNEYFKILEGERERGNRLRRHAGKRWYTYPGLSLYDTNAYVHTGLKTTKIAINLSDKKWNFEIKMNGHYCK